MLVYLLLENKSNHKISSQQKLQGSTLWQLGETRRYSKAFWWIMMLMSRNQHILINFVHMLKVISVRLFSQDKWIMDFTQWLFAKHASHQNIYYNHRTKSWTKCPLHNICMLNMPYSTKNISSLSCPYPPTQPNSLLCKINYIL